MHHGVRLVGEAPDDVGVGDVTDEGIAAGVADGLRLLVGADEGGDLVPVGDECAEDRGTDVAGRAGEEDVHGASQPPAVGSGLPTR